MCWLTKTSEPAETAFGAKQIEIIRRNFDARAVPAFDAQPYRFYLQIGICGERAFFQGLKRKLKSLADHASELSDLELDLPDVRRAALARHAFGDLDHAQCNRGFVHSVCFLDGRTGSERATLAGCPLSASSILAMPSSMSSDCALARAGKSVTSIVRSVTLS